MFDITSYSEIPYTQCTKASVFPLANGEHAGTLRANGKDYTVRITREVAKNGAIDRVWARVMLGVIANDSIDECSMRIAELGAADPAYACLSTDLEDGETGYMRTWTHDFPSDGDMDAFFAETIDFLEGNAEFVATTFAPKP